jgi:hypothetical protein
LAFASLPASAQVDAKLQIPETDEGLPGAGPIRRADWFKKLWAERRGAWAKRVQQDEGTLVFLGDSITQGWGDDIGGAFAGAKVANLIVEIPGGDKKEEIVVIGAHCDSFLGCPGANDNGSGTAATLALARAFAKKKPARTLRFVLFVNNPELMIDSYKKYLLNQFRETATLGTYAAGGVIHVSVVTGQQGWGFVDMKSLSPNCSDSSTSSAVSAICAA